MKLLPCLDGIFWGLTLTAIFINCHLLIHSFFTGYIIFIYYVPVLLIFHYTRRLPAAANPDREWLETCSRLRWSALITAALVPFWGWWQKVMENWYLLVNSCLLAMVAAWYLFNLAGLLKIISMQSDWHNCRRLSSFTRLSVIYLIFGPLLAFTAAAAYTIGRDTGSAIDLFLMHAQLWKKLVLQLPLFLAIITLFLVRRKLRAGRE